MAVDLAALALKLDEAQNYLEQVMAEEPEDSGLDLIRALVGEVLAELNLELEGEET